MICKLTYMSASMLASKYSLQVLFQSFQSSIADYPNRLDACIIHPPRTNELTSQWQRT